MFNDMVSKAINSLDLNSSYIVEESHQPEPVGPEAQKLQRQGRIYRDRGNALDDRASIEHGSKRSRQLYREAKVCHEMAERYFEEAKVLSHFGRPGMKWGIRRTKKQLGSDKGATNSAAKGSAKGDAKAIEKSGKAGAKAGDKAAANEKKLKKQVRKLSDSDLQNAVKRLQMEKQFTELTLKSNPQTKTRMQRGKSEMAKIAKKSAASAIEAHTTNIMKKAITASIQKSSPRTKDYALGKK